MFHRQAPINNNKLENIDNYEDDFEPDSNSDDVTKKETIIMKEYGHKDDIDVEDPPPRASSPIDVEKGQQEVESPGREKAGVEVSDNDSEMDADAYNFTEDQKRAMMELMVQKQEDTDLLDDEPPEYNVKGRLEQLNAELANEPTPVEGDRELKVAFKPEIVDLVAPPPDFSDDESLPNSARGEPQSPGVTPKPDTAQDCPETGSGKSDDDDDDDKNQSENQGKKERQFVVERDGNFEVLTASELTPSERAMYIAEDEEGETSTEKTTEKKTSVEKASHNQNNSSSYQSSTVVPKPPSRPRPNTASAGTKRNVRPAQSPRPKSASHSNGSNSTLDYFSYISPYAMTPEQKEQSKEVGKKTEEERRERERRKHDENEQRHKDSEKSFQAWLRAKHEDRQRRQEEDEHKHQAEQEKSQEDEKEENEEAYKVWLKEKRSQGKKDKLLKRRQQQEMRETFYCRPREECDKAFKEWLRKKNADLRRQHEMEYQRNKCYRTQVKRSKKTQALLKAMRESQAFRYVDYYGYRN